MGEQVYQVIVSDRARQMLGAHLRFLAQADRPAALRLKQRFSAELRSLSRMPQRFPFFNEEYIPLNKYHKMYVENWYLVLYQIRDGTVYAEYILDCRQDYEWLIR
jgi:plasmid stabilization system protein ParE